MPSEIGQLFAKTNVELRTREDSSLSVRSREPLGAYAPSVVHLFRAGAAAHPERWLVSRGLGDDQAHVSWGEARAIVDSLAQALLELSLGPDAPLMLMSGNSIEHLLLSLAAQTVGIPAVPLSAAYSLMSSDHKRLRDIATLCRPGAVFVEDADRFKSALDAVLEVLPTRVIIGTGNRTGAARFDDLLGVTPSSDVETAFAQVGPDSVAKLMFTSGSTGAPKGVITTHRMLCSNQQALGQVWPFLREEPPLLVDWLPWSHTFGGSHNVNQVLAFGGTLHVDDGRPAPQLLQGTLDALRQLAPTVYYNVPSGYALLVPHLEEDAELAANLFSRLRFMFYAAAALPPDLWNRLQAVAARATDRVVPLTASWGATETAPGATTAHFTASQCGCIGVPLPGVELKLIPFGDRFEIRAKGPNVTPGYFHNPDATAAAFDDEGFYRTGDLVRFVDAEDPNHGLFFDSRLGENFKLSSGTWVIVGQVRTGLLSAAGNLLTDAVIVGQDREYAGALAWLNPATVPDLPSGPETQAGLVRTQLAEALKRHNTLGGSASHVRRLMLLSEPPSLDAGEVTDKGYINQRAVTERRAAAVDQMFAEPPGPDVILPAP